MVLGVWLVKKHGNHSIVPCLDLLIPVYCQELLFQKISRLASHHNYFENIGFDDIIEGIKTANEWLYWSIMRMVVISRVNILAWQG